MRPTLVELLNDAAGAGFLVPDFALMQAAAILLGAYLTVIRAERDGLDAAATFRVCLVTIIGALISARLFVAAQDFGYFRQHLGEIPQIWRGGMASSGAFLGGFLAVAAAAWWQRLPLARLLDCAVPGVVLAIALHRVGCFLNGCCFGEASSLPWAVTFPPGSPGHGAQVRAGWIDPHQHTQPVHPTQLYEVALALLVLLVVVRSKRHLRRDGASFALVFLLYPVGRFLIEIVRADDRGAIGPFSTPQVVYLTAFVLAALFLAWRRHADGGLVFQAHRRLGTGQA